VTGLASPLSAVVEHLARQYLPILIIGSMVKTCRGAQLRAGAGAAAWTTSGAVVDNICPRPYVGAAEIRGPNRYKRCPRRGSGSTCATVADPDWRVRSRVSIAFHASCDIIGHLDQLAQHLIGTSLPTRNMSALSPCQPVEDHGHRSEFRNDVGPRPASGGRPAIRP